MQKLIQRVNILEGQLKDNITIDKNYTTNTVVNNTVTDNTVADNIVADNIVADNIATDNIVNDYGSEDISGLTYDTYIKLFQCPKDAISKLIEELHYNIPQNRNINITNINGNNIIIKINGRWIITERKTILNKLLCYGHELITDFINNNMSTLSNVVVCKITKMLYIATTKKTEISSHKHRIQNVIINNRHLIK